MKYQREKPADTIRALEINPRSIKNGKRGLDLKPNRTGNVIRLTKTNATDALRDSKR